MSHSQITQEMFEGCLIKYNIELKLFKSNDLLNLYKKNQKKDKRIYDFCKLQFTKKWLLQNGGTNKHMFINKGKYGGTWMSKELLIQFSNWLKNRPIDEYMRFECKFMKLITDLFKDWFIPEFQYKVGNYRLDAYISELNLAIEYDEPHHISRVLFDKKRQQFIKNKFIRVKQGQEIKGASAIIKHLIRYEKLKELKKYL